MAQFSPTAHAVGYGLPPHGGWQLARLLPKSDLRESDVCGRRQRPNLLQVAAPLPWRTAVPPHRLHQTRALPGGTHSWTVRGKR